MTTTLPTRRRRRGVAAAAAALVGIVAVPTAVAISAQAAPSLTIGRVSGETRYDTAIAASEYAYEDDSAQAVVLASGRSTVDALAASAVAGQYGSPVLLVGDDMTDEQIQDLINEIDRVLEPGANTVILAGGTAAISQDIEDILTSDEVAFDVDRVFGANRYSTAAALSAELETAPSTVFIASGPADATTVSPIAAAMGWPVLLTGSATPAPELLTALEAYPDANYVILGGTGAVSPTVQAAVEGETTGETTRLFGADRYETAVAIADYATDEVGFAAESFGLALGTGGATGTDLADALTSGPILGRAQAPLLLSSGPGELGAATSGYLEDNTGRFTYAGYVFGGTAVVGNSVVDAVAESTDTTPPNGESELPPAQNLPTPVPPTTPPTSTPTGTPSGEPEPMPSGTPSGTPTGASGQNAAGFSNAVGSGEGFIATIKRMFS